MRWKKLWQNEFKDLLPYEKKFRVAGWILMPVFVLVFILEILLPCDLDILVRMVLALTVGCYAVSAWRKQRSMAITFIVAASWNAIRAIYEIVKLFS